MSRHYHFVGIGGIGMSGIAQLLLQSGFKVSGSDLKESRSTSELKSAGADIYLGHDGKNIAGADAVVYSSAVREDNPEIKSAKEKGIRLLKRAQALAELMQDETVITVSGSHGKTTTTSLISYLLMQAGLSPTAVIGGILRNIDTNVCLGEGKYFVAEADESDGSFLCYRPRYSVVTNIDREHLDYYQDFEKEVEAFREFINNTEDAGCVFACSDDINLKRILKDYKKRYVLFGLGEDAHIYPKNTRLEGLSSDFDCIYKDNLIGRFHLSLGGLHNISNALSVIALGMEMGIEPQTIKKTLATYKGARRRLEIKFADFGYLLIDDYAHHPTEIKATLAAAKNLTPQRIIAIFQPHRFSRTKLLLEEFSSSFDAADYLIITDIYAASETPIEGITAKSIYDRIKKSQPQKEIYYLSREDIAGHVIGAARPGDLILTLGAGDITKISDGLAQELKRQGLIPRAAESTHQF
jgi:UDP-N-acetylmuramate--alanine ligase